MRLKALALALGALAVAFTCGGAAADPAPLEDYGRLPAIEDVALSPAGDQIAELRSDGVRHIVRIESADGHGASRDIKLGLAKVRSVRWLTARHLLVLYSVTETLFEFGGPRREWMFGEIVDLSINLAKPLLWQGAGGLNIVFGEPHVRGSREPVVLIEGYIFLDEARQSSLLGRARPCVYAVNLATGATWVQFAGEPDSSEFAIAPDGQIVGETIYSDKRVWALLKISGQEQSVVLTQDTPVEEPELIGLGRATDRLAVYVHGPGQSRIEEVSLDGKSEGDSAFPVSSPHRLVIDPAKDTILAHAAIDGAKVSYRWFDPKDQAAWDRVTAPLAGSRVDPVSISADHGKAVLRIDAPDAGPAYVLADMATGQLRTLGRSYEALGPADISPVQSIAFKAADGLDLTGYLTTPHGRDPKRLPLIVLPHGGPAARDEPGFDWWAQALASRGYAVLQVNFRGSDELGWPLLQAGFGEWGRKMQTDLSGGVRWLADKGIVDPARVCIVGGSYGGYAALAGATLQHGVYRCAVSVSGPSDLPTMIGKPGKQGPDMIQRYWERYMGPPAGFRALSPVANIGADTPPILLIHGKDDTVVPYEQSTRMYGALKAAHRDAQLITLKGEDHWLSRGETRLEMLQATMDFLEKYDPPD